MIKQSKIFEVYEEQKGKRTILLTKNLTPGKTVYDEKLINENGVEYRDWNPRKSKLAATIVMGCPNIFIRKGNVVLYLGAGSGTTASHVSDIVGKEGFVFALDFAPRVVRDLYFVCMERKNIAPILADANHPENYKDDVVKVDIVYQDIAQKNQAEIFLKNIDMFLKDDGYGILAVKAKSIDITKRPGDIYREIKEKLEKKMKIVDFRKLDPFERDHAMFIVKR